MDGKQEFMQLPPQEKTRFKRELKTQILTGVNASYVNGTL
jgi:hypothetical protein